jgi:hypothetical protein
MHAAKSTQTERVTYLTSAERKSQLEAFAKARGESVGSVLRDAVSRYMAEPEPEPTADEEEALKLLLEELNVAVPKMRASLEQSINNMRETREYVDSRLREMGMPE